MRDLLLSDADNTLWDTDRVFAEAQLNVLNAVEARTKRLVSGDRLSFIRSHDQAIARTHKDGLRYPIELLINSVSKSLSPDFQWSNFPEARSEIELTYYTQLRQKPRLRWGVRPSFEILDEAGVEIWIVSEGAEQRVRAKLEEHDLDQYTARIITGKKTKEFYHHIVSLARKRTFCAMIGDQLDRDIVPAKLAGLKTVYLPGQFSPKWIDPNQSKFADWKISNFRELLNLIPMTKQLFEHNERGAA